MKASIKSKIVLAGLTAALLGASTLSAVGAESAASVAQKGLAELAKVFIQLDLMAKRQLLQVHLNSQQQNSQS